VLTNRAIVLFILITAFIVGGWSNLLAQNLVLLHGRFNNKNVLISEGKNIVIETTTNQKVKGKLVRVKDSTLQVNGRIIPIDSIYNLKYRVSNGYKTAIGIVAGIFTVEFAAVTAMSAFSKNTSPFNGSAIGFGIVGTAASFTGFFFTMIFKKRFDVIHDYDLMIVKVKK
jgi:hypothetical protein